jgi:alpha-tubulin suppressor-like RCC1 family protein
MKMKNMKFYSLFTGCLIIIIIFLSTCNQPMETDLFRNIQETVEADRLGPIPDIHVFVGGTELVPGGSCDAFLDAVQDVPFIVQFTIKNTGTGDLSLRESDPIVFSGADYLLFEVLTDPSLMIITPGNTATFTVQFTLDAPGEKSTQIAIYSDDPDANPFAFTASNIALPEIQVLIDGNVIESGETFQFPDVQFGEFLDVTVEIKNIGNAVLELTGTPTVAKTGDSFNLTGSQPEAIVAPGVISNFLLRFDPLEPGTHAGSIIISNTDNDESEYQITFSGNGFLPMEKPVIAAGEGHTVTLKSDGTVWAWGLNNYGQLGESFSISRVIPMQISGFSDGTGVASGWYHTAALKSDGTVWTWGNNDNGQLGDGTTDDNSNPVKVPGLSGIVSIAAGYAHTIALKSDGTVWTWGYNCYGQLGDGTTDDSYTPVQVKGPEGVGMLTGVIAVSSGYCYTVALKADGTVWTWGYNYDGQLGDGTTDDRYTPVQVKGPEGVGMLVDITAIAVGYAHTIALKNDETAWTWGGNHYGALGDDTTENHKTPVQVKGPDGIGVLSGITSISAGMSYTVALKSDSTVWTWGRNDYGQLGHGTTDVSYTPKQISGFSGVIGIATGDDHTISIKNDGTVWTWGRNSFGKLGDGTTTNSTVPLQVPSFLDVTAIAAGEVHMAILKSGGTVWTCGNNHYGELGNGSTDSSTTPVQVTGPDGVGTLSGIIAIGVGIAHTAALKSDGTVWTWGNNSNGELGDGTTTSRTVPVQVKGADGTGILSGVTAIAVGSDHNAALKNDGTVWTWGDNYRGKLGDGTTTNSTTPVQVKGPGGIGILSEISSISAGSSHTTALKNDGMVVWAWGYNGYGQLGDDTTDDHYTPVQVKGPDGIGMLSGVSAIAAGLDYSAALKSDGTVVWTWGNNDYGKLGDSTTTSSTTPVVVSSLSGVAAIAAGICHTVVLKNDGSIWTWGYNGAGGLGDGTTVDCYTPVQTKGPDGVGMILEVSSISVGNGYTAAVKTNGTLWAWGSNGYGQLGDGTTTGSTTPIVSGGPLLLW